MRPRTNAGAFIILYFLYQKVKRIFKVACHLSRKVVILDFPSVIPASDVIPGLTRDPVGGRNAYKRFCFGDGIPACAGMTERT